MKWIILREGPDMVTFARGDELFQAAYHDSVSGSDSARRDKLMAILALLNEEKPANAAETRFPANVSDDLDFVSRVNAAEQDSLCENSEDRVCFRAGVQWMLDQIHAKPKQSDDWVYACAKELRESTKFKGVTTESWADIIRKHAPKE